MSNNDANELPLVICSNANDAHVSSPPALQVRVRPQRRRSSASQSSLAFISPSTPSSTAATTTTGVDSSSSSSIASTATTPNNKPLRVSLVAISSTAATTQSTMMSTPTTSHEVKKTTILHTPDENDNTFIRTNINNNNLSTPSSSFSSISHLQQPQLMTGSIGSIGSLKRERLPSISELDREQRERREQNMLNQGLEHETAFQVALEVAANAMSPTQQYDHSHHHHYHHHHPSPSFYNGEDDDNNSNDNDNKDHFHPQEVLGDETLHRSNIITNALFDIELEQNNNHHSNVNVNSNNDSNNNNPSSGPSSTNHNTIPSLSLPLKEEFMASPPNINDIYMEFPSLSTTSSTSNNNIAHLSTVRMIHPPAPRLAIRPQPPPPPPSSSLEQPNPENNDNNLPHHPHRRLQRRERKDLEQEKLLFEEERVIIPSNNYDENGQDETKFFDLMKSPNSNLFFLRFPKNASAESFLYIEEEEDHGTDHVGDHVVVGKEKVDAMGGLTNATTDATTAQHDSKYSATATITTTNVASASAPMMERPEQSENGMSMQQPQEQQSVELDDLDGPTAIQFRALQQEQPSDDHNDNNDPTNQEEDLQQDDNMSLVASDEASQETNDQQMPSPMSTHSSCHAVEDGSFGCLTGLNALQSLCSNTMPTSTTSSGTTGGVGGAGGAGLSLKKKLLIQPKPRKDSMCDMNNIVPALMESSNASPNSSNATSSMPTSRAASRRNSAATQVTQGSSVYLSHPSTTSGAGMGVGGMVSSSNHENDMVRPAPPGQGTTLYSNTTKSEFFELQQAFSARSLEFEEQGEGNYGVSSTNLDDADGDHHLLDAVSPSNLSESNFRTPTAETSRKRHRYWAGFGGGGGGGNHNQFPVQQGEKRGRAGSIVGLFLPKLFPNSNTSTNYENSYGGDGDLSSDMEEFRRPSFPAFYPNQIGKTKEELTHPLASASNGSKQHPPPPPPPLVGGPFLPSMDSAFLLDQLNHDDDDEEQDQPSLQQSSTSLNPQPSLSSSSASMTQQEQPSLTLSSAASFLGFMNSFSPSKSHTPRKKPTATTTTASNDTTFATSYKAYTTPNQKT